jgi:hypothetical protein
MVLARIHEFLLHYTSKQRHLTSDSGPPASSYIADTAHELWHVNAHSYRSVSVFCIAEFNCTALFFDWYIKFYSFMTCDCSSVGSPSVVLVKGKLSVQGLEGCQRWLPTILNGSWTVDHPQEVPVSKVCYCRHCPQFAEIHAAFKLNTGILGIRCWVGLWINRIGPFLEGLVCCSY